MGDFDDSPPSAADLRARARRALHGANGLKAVAVTGGYVLIQQAVSRALTYLGVLCGSVQERSIDDFLAQKMPGLPPEAAEPARTLLLAAVGEPIPDATLWHQITATLASFMVEGALLAGVAVFLVSLLRGGGDIGQLFAGFRRFLRTGGLNVLRTLRIALWSLLFLVPGVLAFYSYRMAYFLLADNPDMTAARALAESKRMMRGNRWRLMCLEASFIGWLLLVVATFGLALVFVLPYMLATFAAFYEDLLDRAEDAAPAPPTEGKDTAA